MQTSNPASPSDSQLTLLAVEVERVETQIISLHVMTKVVSSEAQDMKGLRQKELLHDAQGSDLA